MEQINSMLDGMELGGQLEEQLPVQAKQPVKNRQIAGVVDQFEVFRFGTRETDQDLARKLYDALAATQPHLARHIAMNHTIMCKHQHEYKSENLGKWDIIAPNGHRQGYISMSSDYLGNIFLQDKELGNIYCEIGGLVKENFQATNNIKLVVKTDQLGEICGAHVGILLLAAEGADGQRLRGRLELHPDTTNAAATLPYEGGSSFWDLVGIRCS